MEIKELFMYLIGGLSVVSSLGVVCSRKSLNSALSLVATMFLIAAMFGLMRADFIATLQVLVYTGAIMILFVFVIMLLGAEKEAEKFSLSVPAYFSIPFVFLFLGILVYGVQLDPLILGKTSAELGQATLFTPQDIGRNMLVNQVVSFQAIGILLLSAVVGAAYLAQTSKKPLMKGRGLKAVQDKHGVSE